MMKYIMMMGMLVAAVASVLAAGKKEPDNVSSQAVLPVAAREAIQGQVFYQERIALPHQAFLTVQLVDITNAQNPGKIVTQTLVPIESPVPIPFTLPLADTHLETDHIYALAARISAGDVLWFATANPLAINRERDSYLIRLEPVDLTLASEKSTLREQEWSAKWIEGQDTIEPHPSLIIEDMNEEEFGVTKQRSKLARYKVAGTGSCNRYFSTALLDEEKNQIQFSPLGMTFMACMDEILNQEIRFINMMGRVKSYQMEEAGLLHLLDENGEIIARFSAKF